MDRADPHLDPPEDIPAVSAEELVDGALPEGETPGEPRRYPSTIGGMFYLLVLTVALVGVGLVATGSWRSGVKVIGGSLLLAAAVRLVLSDRDAGMLAVRHKSIDVTLLVVVGMVMVFLAGSIPNQPG